VLPRIISQQKLFPHIQTINNFRILISNLVEESGIIEGIITFEFKIVSKQGSEVC